MKKIFTLLSFLLIVLSATAQQKWDFSDLTSAMEAISQDQTNWEIDKTNSKGEVTQYHYVTIPADENTPTSILCGNGNLKATEGLLFKGITKSNSFVISVNSSTRHYFKINSGNIKMIIPNLKKGQTVTIIGKTGSSSSARSFTAEENLTIMSGFDPTTEDQTCVATVNADGEVAIGVTSSMNVYSIEVNGEGSDTDNEQPSTTGKKCWDFTDLTGTLSLLASDPENWAVNKTESDGRISEYDNVFKIGKTEQKPCIYAGGTVPVTEGLLFSNAGVGKLLFSTHRASQHYFKLNGSDIQIIIPNLKKGSTITVDLEGASTTEARGLDAINITPTTGYFNNPQIGVQTDSGIVAEDGDVILTSTAGVNIFKIVVDETTDIKTIVKVNTPSDHIYNLAGQKVSKSYKGIVIINDKKYIQK